MENFLMNKKLMAVAVAGALAAPVAMAQSNVTVSGRLSMGVDSYSASGASTTGSTYASRNRMWDNGSRLIVSGTEDLGNGLKANFYVESGFNADTGGSTSQSGTANTSTGLIASRVAYAGLQGDFGAVRFGRQNVFWTNGTQDQTQSNYVQAGGVFQTGSFGSGMGVGVTRFNNVVQYDTPTIGGFGAQISWSPNAQEAIQLTSSYSTGVTSANAQTSVDTKGRLWGVTLGWTGGPFAVHYDFVSNKTNTLQSSQNGTANSVFSYQGENRGDKLRMGWAYQPGAMLALIWTKSTVVNGGASTIYNTTGGNNVLLDGTGGTLTQTAWTVNWEHMVGNTRLLAQYGRAANVSGCTGTIGANTTTNRSTLNGMNSGDSNCAATSASNYMLGAQYLMSKRTSVAFTYNQLNNKANYFADYGSGGNSSVAGSATAAGVGNVASGVATSMAGADPKMFGVGVLHSF